MNMPGVKSKTNNKSRKKNSNVDVAEKYFNCTPGERAAFEAGIKLGAIFHQFVGTPVDLDNVSALENAIQKSVLVQPFVERVKLNIDRKLLEKHTPKSHRYNYRSLTGDMIKAQIEIKYKNSFASAKLNNIEALDYPLMYLTVSNKR